MGAPVAGANIGSSLGATISRWLGSGDYSVSSNSLVQRVQNGSPAIPMMHAGGQTVVVRHKEYLGEILSSQNFQVRHVYDLNPGLSYTFPWLSDIARGFQEYRIKGMVFHYVPTSGTAISGTNPAVGTVMIQTSYRATEAPPASKVEMLNEYWACEAAPNEAFCHPIECDPKENPFNIQYIRSGTLPSTENQLMYDLGRTFVAVSGQPATGNVIGDLWVTYEVEFKKPIINSSVVTDPVAATISSVSGFTPTASNYFGSASNQIVVGPLGITASTNTLTFPKGAQGEYLILLRFATISSWTAVNTAFNPTYSNCVNRNIFINTATGSSQVYGTNVNGTPGTQQAFLMLGVIIADPQQVATVTFSSSLSITGASIGSFDLQVSRLNASA